MDARQRTAARGGPAALGESVTAASPSTSRPLGARGVATGVALFVVLGVWMALAVLRPFLPDIPKAGLDSSWIAAMAEAADRGRRWGVDVAFTYGPASPLVTLYGNGSYLTHTLPLLLGLCLVVSASVVTLFTRSGSTVFAVVAVVTLGFVAAHARLTPDAVFLLLPLLAAMVRLSRRDDGRAVTSLAAVTAAAAGATGVAKLSFLPGALAICLVVDATMLARRRAPLLVAAFAAGFVVTDLAYGQALSDLPAFLRLGGEVVAGYSEAMALDGSRRELVAFILAGAALVALVALAERRNGASSRSPFALPLCLGAALFMMFKGGFVRQDLHTHIGWNGLALAAVVVGPVSLWRWRPVAAGVVMALAVGLVVLVDVVSLSPGGLAAMAAIERQTLVTDPLDQVEGAAWLARDPAGAATELAENRAEAWRAVAAANPLPALVGSIDAIPSIQSAIIAGHDYRPRPSFQEYSTYTEALSQANRAFLEGPRAPDWILFGVEPASGQLSIDSRYPNFAEGSLWPDLLRLYAPGQREGALLALHRRATPAPLALGPPHVVATRLDTAIPVDMPGPIFATVDIRPTLLGRIAGLLYRPAPLVMRVGFADGHEKSYQFIGGIGRSGFVLSPLVEDAGDFAALADGTAAPADRRVVSILFHAPPKLGALVDAAIAVTLRSMTIGVAPPP